MDMGVNVPNFGPGTDPGVLREWARVVEGLGFDLLMMSDHVAITADVAEQYPEPFYEPLTTLAWLAGVTSRLKLGTTVLILPYRHPLLVSRMVANLRDLTGDRFVLGVGAGWARQEFEALGVPYGERGRLTEEYLTVLSEAGHPIWVGGNSPAAIRRAIRHGKPWHPLRGTLAWMGEAVATHDLPGFVPRITLRLTTEPVVAADRPAGTGTIEQIVDDLDRLRALGASSVVLDPYNGDLEELRRPQEAWRALTAVATHWRSRS